MMEKLLDPADSLTFFARIFQKEVFCIRRVRELRAGGGGGERGGVSAAFIPVTSLRLEGFVVFGAEGASLVHWYPARGSRPGTVEKRAVVHLKGANAAL